jgi:hypothetical protein
MHALKSIAELVVLYAASPVEIARDIEELAGIEGFTEQPTDPAPHSSDDPSTHE